MMNMEPVKKAAEHVVHAGVHQFSEKVSEHVGDYLDENVFEKHEGLKTAARTANNIWYILIGSIFIIAGIGSFSISLIAGIFGLLLGGGLGLAGIIVGVKGFKDA